MYLRKGSTCARRRELPWDFRLTPSLGMGWTQLFGWTRHPEQNHHHTQELMKCKRKLWGGSTQWHNLKTLVFQVSFVKSKMFHATEFKSTKRLLRTNIRLHARPHKITSNLLLFIRVFVVIDTSKLLYVNSHTVYCDYKGKKLYSFGAIKRLDRATSGHTDTQTLTRACHVQETFIRPRQQGPLVRFQGGLCITTKVNNRSL